MPELPDITIYLESLERHIVGHRLAGLRIGSPFLLRSVAPAPETCTGREVRGVRRLGKRVVMELEGKIFLVLHLMVAGRLRWRDPGAKLHRKMGLAAFDFGHGSLVLTEAGSKKRASLHVVEGEQGLAAHDPGGIDVIGCSPGEFRKALLAERHTLKRSLTDPRLFSGIGNAYSDEILHRARLSPFRMSDALDASEVKRLHSAVVQVLEEWTGRLRRQVGDGFPDKVTAFHEEMAVHGRYRKPCPVCTAPVQRIVYSENEANYCPGCQTGGKILADRALSRLLKDDWPGSLEELEERARKTARDFPGRVIEENDGKS